MIEMPIARKNVFVNGLCAHEEKRSKVKLSQIIFSTELTEMGHKIDEYICFWLWPSLNQNTMKLSSHPTSTYF